MPEFPLEAQTPRQVSSLQRQQKHRRNKWLLGGLVLAVTVLGLSFLNLEAYTVYFYTPEEAVQKAASLQGKDIKVGGMVLPGSSRWEAETLALNFVISDLNKRQIAVSYRGSPPDMFKENQGVVVEGKIAADGRSFVARTLMVKHSEEYKVPEQGHSIDKELLEKSIFK